MLRDIPASDREALLRVKVTERSALVQVAASTQQLTSHAGLLLVRELATGGSKWAYILIAAVLLIGWWLGTHLHQ